MSPTAGLKRLNAQEWLFLQMAPRGVHWYAIVAGLCDPPDGPRPQVDELAALAASRVHFAPDRFRQRVVETPLRLAAPVWVDDARFEMAAHVSSAGLGPDATKADFRAFCARLASAPIDLTRPPWDFHLVEHVDGDGLGFVIRAHHCMLDGTGMTAFVGLFAELVATPAAIDEPQPWRPQSPPSRSRLARSGVADSARRSADAIADGWRRAVRVREWGESAREAARTASAVRELIAPVGAKTEFNRPTSDSRTVDFTHASLAAAKDLAHARGATINHVGIAVVTDALRRFFDCPGARRPARALKLLVPVSYEPHSHDGEPGAEPAAAEEHIGFATVALPLEEPDPDVRLAAIVAQAHDQTEHSSPERVDELMRHIARDSDRLYRLAQRIVQSPRTAALTLSNVRGPAFPIYLRGARIRELYPLLPLGPHHDLAVGMLSLEEELFFAAMRTDSGHDSLAEFGGYMEEAVASLGLAPRRGDRPPQADPNDQPKSTNGG